MAKKLTARFVLSATTIKPRADFTDGAVPGLQLRVTKAGVKSWALKYTRRSDGVRRRLTLGTVDALAAARLQELQERAQSAAARAAKEAKHAEETAQTSPSESDASERAKLTRREADKAQSVAAEVTAAKASPEERAKASLESARLLARDALAEIGEGADPAAETEKRKAGQNFAALADEWIKRHGTPNKSPRALRDDRCMLARHVLPEIGTLGTADITKRDVIRMLDAVAAKPDARTEKTKARRKLTHRPNRVFELVRAIFRWGVGRDLLKADPTFGLSPPIKKERERDRTLSPDEIKTLWEALGKAPAARRGNKGVARGERVLGDGDIPMTKATALTLKLALVTAQRIGEVAGIALAELDLNDTAPLWTVPGERSKNGQPNRVPLSPLAVRLIAEARELAGESEWLFPSASGASAIDPHAPTKALERARPAIGLANFRVHDLRRTAATRLAEMGISPHTISLVLNHVSARRGTITGAVYVQYSYDREKREALDAWGARLERIIAGTDAANVVPISRLLRAPES